MPWSPETTIAYDDAYRLQYAFKGKVTFFYFQRDGKKITEKLNFKKIKLSLHTNFDRLKLIFANIMYIYICITRVTKIIILQFETKYKVHFKCFNQDFFTAMI